MIDEEEDMKLLKKDELKSHDVYEFCYAKDRLNHWNQDSLYLIDEEFWRLAPYLDQTFSNFAYYGSQKVKLTDWEKIRQLALEEDTQEESIIMFFNEINEWIEKDITQEDHFWILGL